MKGECIETISDILCIEISLRRMSQGRGLHKETRLGSSDDKYIFYLQEGEKT